MHSEFFRSRRKWVKNVKYVDSSPGFAAFKIFKLLIPHTPETPDPARQGSDRARIHVKN